jgi:hypothetical protein
MKLLKWETIQGENYIIIEAKDYITYAILTDKNNRVIESYTNGKEEHSFYQTTEEELKSIKQFIIMAKIKTMFSVNSGIKKNLNAVAVFESIKEMVDVTDELYEKIWFFVDDHSKQGKKNNLSESLISYYNEVKLENKITRRMSPFEFASLFGSLSDYIILNTFKEVKDE